MQPAWTGSPASAQGTHWLVKHKMPNNTINLGILQNILHKKVFV
jgi:hypothetical protein